MEKEKQIEKEIGVVVDRLTSWLDTYLTTRGNTLSPSLDFKKSVLDKTASKTVEALETLKSQYVTEEEERQKRKERGDGPHGWYLYQTEGKSAVSWPLIERNRLDFFNAPKERFHLYSRHTSGIICPQCWSGDNKELDPNCKICWGTNFEGGYSYHYPIPALHVRRDEEPGSLKFHTSFFRRLVPGDVVIDEDEKRFTVKSISSITKVDADQSVEPPVWEGWFVWAEASTGGAAGFPTTHNSKNNDNK